MKIELSNIKVRDLVDGYVDNGEKGVRGFGGNLDIRPPYQREFVYDDKQRDAVIDTLTKDFPLNVMYWVRNGPDDYEVLDGQQRTISICKYVNNDFSIDYKLFHTLSKEAADQILDYELTVYICEGTNDEKLDWFRTVNIAGEKLTDQELRNAVYAGPFVSSAKRHFSQTGGPAALIASDYMSGVPIRQHYLETALKWVVDRDGLPAIEEYMAIHKNDPNANDIWLYFRQVIEWVDVLFPNTRKEMKSVKWGIIYNEFKNSSYDADVLEDRIKFLMMDEDVTKKSGIYPYLFDGKESHLSIRSFSAAMKREAYERQNGKCVNCGDPFPLDKMHADHIDPWHSGGRTVASNCQMLCESCNRRKSGI